MGAAADNDHIGLAVSVPVRRICKGITQLRDGAVFQLPGFKKGVDCSCTDVPFMRKPISLNPRDFLQHARIFVADVEAAQKGGMAVNDGNFAVVAPIEPA
jgi:hypothetical protein